MVDPMRAAALFGELKMIGVELMATAAKAEFHLSMIVEYLAPNRQTYFVNRFRSIELAIV